MKKSTKIIFLVVALIVVACLFLFYRYGNTAKDVSTSEFFKEAGLIILDGNEESEPGDVVALSTDNTYNGQTILYDGRKFGQNFIIVKEASIKKIVINAYNIIGYDATDTARYTTSYPRSEEFEKIILAFMSEDMRKEGFVVDYTDPNAGALWSSLIMPVLLIGVSAVLLVSFMSRQAQNTNKSSIDFGKTKARVTQNIKVRFSDVAGAEEEKQELQEVVEFLKNPKKFSALGAKIPKGVLLVGNPGTGKTLFAKAVAGEANVPFFSISGSDFVEMFVGVGASRVRDLFNMAKKAMPCIVFIDEIDAVGRQRGAGLGGGNDEREQTLNQLLVQMDGFEANEGIIIIAATNRADILDPALLRPGRFDRQIYVNLPDVKGREAILKVHARNKPLAQNVNFKTLARMTAGFSGADLANLLNEAAILAARANKTVISNTELFEGMEKVVMGPAKKSRLVTETDKRITAYHEAGHAVLATRLPLCHPVHEVTIIPRGRAEGYTMTRPDSDDKFVSKNRMLQDLIMTLGGRAAEEIMIKDYTGGAYGDIKEASKTARQMVSALGMSEKIGPVDYYSDEQIFVGRDYQTKTNYSEATAKLIDEEVERIIKEAHEKAVEMLNQDKDFLERMTRVLVERETIYEEEVKMLADGASVQEVLSFMDRNRSEEHVNAFGFGDSSRLSH